MPDLRICQIAAVEDKDQLILVPNEEYAVGLENNPSKGKRILELKRHGALCHFYELHVSNTFHLEHLSPGVAM